LHGATSSAQFVDHRHSGPAQAGSSRNRQAARPLAASKANIEKQPAPASDRQAFAPFGTARVDHGAATAGFHPHEKAVGALPAGFGRLISPLHDIDLNKTAKS
jgi:hypothetical protein